MAKGTKPPFSGPQKEAEPSLLLNVSYLNQKRAKNRLRDLGYTYDDRLSTNENKVFTDRNGKPNIAFRGTKRVKDYVADAMLAVGLEKYNPRFQEAKKLTKIVEETYKQPANAFGHSLGGALAEKAGAHGTVFTYNKGAGLGDIGRTIPRRQTDIRTSDDIVSALSATQRHPYNNFREIPTHGADFLAAHSIDKLQYE
jgi:hypothetical protein